MTRQSLMLCPFLKRLEVKNTQNCRLVSLNSIPGNIIGAHSLGVYFQAHTEQSSNQ